jgi:ankyrin repeat protein
VKLCLERGADVNAVNEQGFRAIHGAANRGFDAMIVLALSDLAW